MKKRFLCDELGVEPLAMKIFAGIVLLVIGLGIGYAVYTWAGGWVRAMKCDLSFNKDRAVISRGDNDIVQITVRYIMGTKESVTLDATGEPAGVSVSFNPLSGEPDFYSNMTISVSADAEPGNYVLTIIVKDGNGSTSGSAPFNLTVQ